MKRLIIFLLLFAAIKVAGQTTGYLRFDTVKIMKQNGTCELYIINKTKDTLGILTNVGGGLTQFRKSRVLNDSTIVVGLDTLVIIGGAGGGGGSGSVTSITQGYGIVATPNPITSTGTIRADTSGTNGLVTRTELLDSTDITTQVESPIYVKLRSSWPVPDTLAIDTTVAATRAWLYKVADSLIVLMASSGVANTNLGAGFRWLVPGSQGIKTAENTATVTWDSVGTNTLRATVPDNAITDAKLRQSAGLSVIGRSANSTGNVADITAGSDNQVLRRSGTTLGFGAVNLGNSNAVSGELVNANIAAFKTYPAEKSLGIIYEKSQWSDITGDFQPNSSGSNLLSISSGYLNSSAASFSYNNYVRILPGRPTNLNRWKMTVRFRNTAWSANSFEFGVGIYSAVTHSGAAFGYIAFLQTTSSGSGNLFIYDQSGSTQRATGSGTVTYALNDEIELTYTYNDSVLTFTAQNITTGGTLRTATYTFPANMSVILPNNGNWGLFEGNGGTGTHQVRYIKIESLETQYPNLLIIGNSKTKGYYADFYNLRFPSQLNSTYPTVVWNAGSAERLTDMITRLDEFTQLNASQVWLVDAASNQLRAGTSIADTWVLYDYLTRALEGGGATVLHSVLPEDSTGGGLGQTAWNALINAKYPGRVIGLYAGMSTGNIGNAAYLNADKVHLSQAGHNQVVSLAISSGLLTTISTQRRAPYRVHDDVVKFTGDSLHFKWKVRSRNNYVPRWSTNLDELTTGPLYMDSISLIASLSTRPAKPLSTMFASFEGAVASYGTQGSYFTFDRTTPANYYGWYSDNNILRFLYNGTDRAYLNSIGALRLGNASTPTASGMLQIKINQTLTGTLGRIGVNLNVDTTITTAPNTGHPFIVGSSIGPHAVISTSSGNTTTAANFYIADSMVASTNHVFLGKSYALYINNGRTRLATTDSVGTATGGFLFKDFSTGEVKITGAPAGVTQSALDDTAAAIRSAMGASGEYSPTLTATTNLDAVTLVSAHYYRTGNYCIVYINFTADPTATGFADFGVSLPFASEISASSEVIGNGALTAGGGSVEVATISGDVTNNRAVISLGATATSTQAYFASFSYKIIPP